MRENTRGQAYTLEGVVSAIIIASALIVGLQAVDPAPWTQDESFNTEEYRTQVSDMLAVASDGASPSGDDALTTAVTCVDPQTGELSEEGFTADSEIGELLEQTVGERDYRVTVEYRDETGDDVVESLTVSNTAGEPSGTSVTVTRQHPVYNNDRVFVFDGDDCEKQEERIGDVDDHPISEKYEDDQLYVIVTVRVVVW